MVSTRGSMTRGDDLAVLLNGHSFGDVVFRSNCSCQFSVAVEAGIQAAVSVVTRQAKLVVAANCGVPSSHDFAVALDRNGSGNVLACADWGHYFAVSVESCVRAAVHVVAGQSKVIEHVAATIGGCISRHDDLAVRLKCHG